MFNPLNEKPWLLAPIVLFAVAPVQLVGQSLAPQAASLLSQTLAALTHGVPLIDAKLQANVNYVAGSDEETGIATFEAVGHLQSRVTLNHRLPATSAAPRCRGGADRSRNLGT
jgi:hypothetical protein